VLVGDNAELGFNGFNPVPDVGYLMGEDDTFCAGVLNFFDDFVRLGVIFFLGRKMLDLVL